MPVDYTGIPNSRDLKIRDAMKIKDKTKRLMMLKAIAKGA
tara:strand:+ start:260 stop:379 length:120 start_codon:yes stop_codon:yes gene_type:complete